MISVQDALNLLYWHDTFVEKNRGLIARRMMSNEQTEQISELIKHLARECELEIAELLAEGGE